MLRSSFCLLATLFIGCSGAPAGETRASAQGTGVRLQEVAHGLERPLYLTSPPGDRRLFVVEQPGRIRIIENGQLLPTAFLDLTDRVGSSGNEQGLLSVAFHPSYASNGFLFVDYTDRNGDTRIERYQVGSDRNRADPASARQLLFVDQPYSNHNGGLVLFGPDGMLYIGMGDGGSGGDPNGNGQNLNSLLGKLLRIDVDHGDPYAIPAGNPFVGRSGARGEIWAYGVRNPWRFSFDPGQRLFYLADVGQDQWEEVDVVGAAQAGLDYGWNRMEGTHCFREGCDRAGLVIPQEEYGHSDGCSVTGGYVYRGKKIPSVVGHYFYGDYCGGWVKSFRYAGGAVSDETRWEFGSIGQVLSFGQDSDGELYVLSMNGKVYRLDPA